MEYRNDFILVGRVMGGIPPFRRTKHDVDFQPMFVNCPFRTKDGREIENQIYVSFSGKIALKARDTIREGFVLRLQGKIITTEYELGNSKTWKTPMLKCLRFEILEHGREEVPAT